jgi:hypothetical protein
VVVYQDWHANQYSAGPRWQLLLEAFLFGSGAETRLKVIIDACAIQKEGIEP